MFTSTWILPGSWSALLQVFSLASTCKGRSSTPNSCFSVSTRSVTSAHELHPLCQTRTEEAGDGSNDVYIAPKTLHVEWNQGRRKEREAKFGNTLAALCKQLEKDLQFISTDWQRLHTMKQSCRCWGFGIFDQRPVLSARPKTYWSMRSQILRVHKHKGPTSLCVPMLQLFVSWTLLVLFFGWNDLHAKHSSSLKQLHTWHSWWFKAREHEVTHRCRVTEWVVCLCPRHLPDWQGSIKYRLQRSI